MKKHLKKNLTRRNSKGHHTLQEHSSQTRFENKEWLHFLNTRMKDIGIVACFQKARAHLVIFKRIPNRVMLLSGSLCLFIMAESSVEIKETRLVCTKSSWESKVKNSSLLKIIIRNAGGNTSIPTIITYHGRAT